MWGLLAVARPAVPWFAGDEHLLAPSTGANDRPQPLTGGRRLGNFRQLRHAMPQTPDMTTIIATFRAAFGPLLLDRQRLHALAWAGLAMLVAAAAAAWSGRSEAATMFWHVAWRTGPNTERSAGLGRNVGGVRLCGSAGVAYLLHDGGRSTLRYLGFDDGRSTILTRGQFAQPLACSPDGRFVLHRQVEGCLNHESCNDDQPDARDEVRLIDRLQGTARPVAGLVVNAAWDGPGRFLLYSDQACSDPGAVPAKLPSSPGWIAVRYCPTDQDGGEWLAAGAAQWAIVRAGHIAAKLELNAGTLQETRVSAPAPASIICGNSSCVRQVAMP